MGFNHNGHTLETAPEIGTCQCWDCVGWMVQRIADLERRLADALPLIEFAVIELEARGFDHDRPLWETGKRLIAEAGRGA